MAEIKEGQSILEKTGGYMEQKKSNQFIIALVSVGCMGLIVESMLLGWEFWVLPLIAIGNITLWWMHFSERVGKKVREIFTFGFAGFIVFFHGVHAMSFFDVAVVILFAMTVFSFMDHTWMIHLFMAEYVVIMMIQTVLAMRGKHVAFDVLNVSKIVLHQVVVLCVYYCCVRAVYDRIRSKEYCLEKDRCMYKSDGGGV